MTGFFKEMGNWFSGFFGYTKDTFTGFKVSYVFDILLMAILFYLVMSVFANRKSGKMIVCMAVWTLLLAVSGLIGANVLFRIAKYVYQIGIIALFVIFRNDCKDSLDEFIRNPFGKNEKRSSYSELDRTITEITNAVTDLAREDFGALIIIERSQNLDDIVSTGIRLDSKVTSKLLRTIFYRGTPLHDGAVIIRGNKIAAARCFLPLAEPVESNEKYDLGTRHLAAMGMAARSDAVVVVVSEETKIISIACGSDLLRGYYGDNLKTELLKLLVGNVKE